MGNTPRDVKLISGRANPQLAAELAETLDLELESVEAGRFADGETHVHIAGEVQHATVVIVQPTSPPVNDHLLELALLADAARAAGAARVVGVVPYFGYARQEQRSASGDPRSAQVVARLLADVRLDHIITLDLHAPALESAFQMPINNLRPDAMLLPAIERWGLHKLVMVSPDAGGLKRAQRFASALKAELAVVAKARPSPDVAKPLQVLGNVDGRNCVLVDDMASTGRTMAGAADALHSAGASSVHAVFTHAVMAGGALERLCESCIEALVTTNSVSSTPHPRLQVVSIAPLLAEAVNQVVGSGG